MGAHAEGGGGHLSNVDAKLLFARGNRRRDLEHGVGRVLLELDAEPRLRVAELAWVELGGGGLRQPLPGHCVRRLVAERFLDNLACRRGLGRAGSILREA